MMQKYQDSSLSPEERASDLLARMNLDEKFGQIQCYNAIDSFLGKSVEKQNPYGVGQVCILIATMLDDVGSVAGLITRLQKQIMESGKHHIPAIFHGAIRRACHNVVCRTRLRAGRGNDPRR